MNDKDKLTMSERWEQIYNEAHNFTKEEYTTQKLKYLLEDLWDDIVVECIQDKYFIQITLKEETSVSFCNLFVEKINKELGGEEGLNSAIIDITYLGELLCRYLISKGEIVNLFIKEE